MARRLIATALTVAVTGVLASTASAAVVVGNECVATSGTGGLATFVQIARATPNSASLTIPSSGVITSWKVNSSIESTYTQKLKVFRSAGGPKKFTAVGESSTQPISKGVNSFPTQIPVQAGDRVGISGSGSNPAAFYCTTGVAGDEFGNIGTETPVGSTTEFGVAVGALVAVSAIVEPDADGDGFGDETQDKCPRSAKLQTECPPLALASYGIASKNSALFVVTASVTTPVSVSATVTVPGKSKNGKKGKAKTLKLSGPTQTVAPGQLGRFVLAYSVPLKAALSALPPKQSLGLTVTASGTDAAGVLSSNTIIVRLKGQAKPK